MSVFPSKLGCSYFEIVYQRYSDIILPQCLDDFIGVTIVLKIFGQEPSMFGSRLCLFFCEVKSWISESNGGKPWIPKNCDTQQEEIKIDIDSIPDH